MNSLTNNPNIQYIINHKPGTWIRVKNNELFSQQTNAIKKFAIKLFTRSEANAKNLVIGTINEYCEQLRKIDPTEDLLKDVIKHITQIKIVCKDININIYDGVVQNCYKELVNKYINDPSAKLIDVKNVPDAIHNWDLELSVLNSSFVAKLNETVHPINLISQYIAQIDDVTSFFKLCGNLIKVLRIVPTELSLTEGQIQLIAALKLTNSSLDKNDLLAAIRYSKIYTSTFEIFGINRQEFEAFAKLHGLDVSRFQNIPLNFPPEVIKREVKSPAIEIEPYSQAKESASQLKYDESLRDFPEKERWRFFIDFLSFIRTEHKKPDMMFDDGEPGYNKAMIEGFRYVRNNLDKRMNAKAFEKLHDTCVSGVISKERDSQFTQGFQPGCKIPCKSLIERKDLINKGKKALKNRDTSLEALKALINEINADFLIKNNPAFTILDELQNNPELLRQDLQQKINFLQIMLVEIRYEWQKGLLALDMSVEHGPAVFFAVKTGQIYCAIYQEIIGDKIHEIAGNYSIGQEYRVDEIFDKYYEEIKKANGNKKLELIAIARICRALEMFHAFLDGNQRTIAFALLTKLLVENDFPPSILWYPAMFDGDFTLDALVDQIIIGMGIYFGLCKSFSRNEPITLREGGKFEWLAKMADEDHEFRMLIQKGMNEVAKK